MEDKIERGKVKKEKIGIVRRSLKGYRLDIIVVSIKVVVRSE